MGAWGGVRGIQKLKGSKFKERRSSFVWTRIASGTESYSNNMRTIPRLNYDTLLTVVVVLVGKGNFSAIISYTGKHYRVRDTSW